MDLKFKGSFLLEKISVFIFFPLLLVSFTYAEETTILRIELNREPKGDFFVLKSGDEFFLKAEDLERLGIKGYKGEKYVLLKDIPGSEIKVDEEKGVLFLDVPPEILPMRKIEVFRKKEGVSSEETQSLFLNYGVSFSKGNAFQKLSLSQEVGIRSGRFLLLSSSVYTPPEGFKRVFSTLYLEREKQNELFFLGDQYVSSKGIGSNLAIFGIGYSKDYSYDSYFSKNLAFNYTGYLKYPSELTVTLDGLTLKKEKLPPGGFDLRNLVATSGKHDLEITVKDIFGREEIIYVPFYTCDSILKRGLHEFSYNLGFLHDRGKYKKPAFSFFHRYGLNESLTLGVRGEGNPYKVNFASLLTFSTLYGVFDLDLGGSLSKLGKGYAACGGYSFSKGGTGFDVKLSLIGKKFSVLTKEWRKNTVIFSSGIRHGTKTLGFFSLSYMRHEDVGLSSFSLSYSKNLSKDLLLSLYGRVCERRRDISALITYALKDHFISVEAEKDKESARIQKKTPLNGGVGYRLDIERRSGKLKISPNIQYNSPNGIHTLEYEKDAVFLNTSGSILYTEGHLAISKPVYDSFAIVQVPNLKNVRVYKENVEVGTTGKNGTVVIPSIASRIINEIKIDDKDVPLEYSIFSPKKNIVVPRRSGKFVKFELKKIKAVTGILMFNGNPVELKEGKLRVQQKEIPFVVGRGGEFYIEDIHPGRYEGEIVMGEQILTFKIYVPPTEEAITDIGVVHVEKN